MKSYLKNYRQSPRKVRLLANLIKGKSVQRASTELKFTKKRASLVFGKLLDSAVANAKETASLDRDRLFIKEVRVDEGPTLKRIKARARGSAHMIRKRSSNIAIELAEKQGGSSKKTEKKVEKKEAVKSKSKPKV